MKSRVHAKIGLKYVNYMNTFEIAGICAGEVAVIELSQKFPTHTRSYIYQININLNIIMRLLCKSNFMFFLNLSHYFSGINRRVFFCFNFR